MEIRKICEVCSEDFAVDVEEDWKTMCLACYIKSQRKGARRYKSPRPSKADSNGTPKEVDAVVSVKDEPSDDLFLKFAGMVGNIVSDLEEKNSSHLRELESVVGENNLETRWTIESARLVVSRIREDFEEAKKLINTTIKQEYVVKIGELTTPVEGLRHKQFEQVLLYVANKIPVMLVGPAGSGKTHLTEQIATSLSVPHYFTGAISSKYDLIGYMNPMSEKYIESDYYRAFSGGGVFLWDEMDASVPEAFPPFHAGLSNGYSDFPCGKTMRSDDFYPMGACNTFGRGADRVYVGRNQLDGATLDRYAVIEIEYDEELEVQLAAPSNTEEENWVRDVVRWRQGCHDNKIRHIISPRATLYGVKMMRAGAERPELDHTLIWKGLDSSQIRKVKGV